VAVEYDPVHERAGSIRMHETLPFFSGRPGIEGVYNQSSTTTHPVYYLISELFPSSPNPFRSRTYSQFDLDSGLARLPLLNVSHIVAVSERLASALDLRAGVVREARVPPYTSTAWRPGAGYVEPLAFAPVRSHGRLARPGVPLVLPQAAQPRRPRLHGRPGLRGRATDPWAPPPERPLRGGGSDETLEAESIRITTSRPGHPSW